MTGRESAETVDAQHHQTPMGRLAEVLRRDTVGGFLLLGAALLALVWANSPWSDGYEALGGTQVGADVFGLHLDLSLSAWAADGLLAIFFFVVGLELKREFVAGDLRDPRRAALPVAAAVGGMMVPAALFIAVTYRQGADAMQGWAIPAATDIAFAIAILAVVATHLPVALRTFLLTLAVVDDLLAITIIAVFYSDSIDLTFLGLAVIPLVLFAILVQRRITSWWLLVPLAGLTWTFVHESGVHATVAGVLLGFTVPVLRAGTTGDRDDGPGLAERFEHTIRPLSSGVAVPVFAFFAAGVAFGGVGGLVSALQEPVAMGIVAGLVIGKVVGIFGTTWLVASVTPASLDSSLKWVDVIGAAMLAGIGFTVSLLIGELAFAGDPDRQEYVKVGVLFGSVVSATLATVLLRSRNRHYRRQHEHEVRDRSALSVE
ncbi:MAG: Na+/H+ antiporter NhaA [Gordonia sp.]|uniref:Na+/H+ antiporter NhaA n=1 Tax=Gordonia sp. (in: high G+C Gram-positive bacteria) TaxID=84139 RepID=UPI000C54DF6D|nr:Na+/H+ antiporter NhaA [Gordonia sp. (in: high G+C Gram-positive bacteria)]MAU82375.1 Na+/H+ antiporter NhaA [Gordonia sp. (in: high G+C Gram-positive bacteria)]